MYLGDFVLSFLLIGSKSLKEVAWLPFCTSPDEGLDGWNVLARFGYFLMIL